MGRSRQGRGASARARLEIQEPAIDGRLPAGDTDLCHIAYRQSVLAAAPGIKKRACAALFFAHQGRPPPSDPGKALPFFERMPHNLAHLPFTHFYTGLQSIIASCRRRARQTRLDCFFTKKLAERVSVTVLPRASSSAPSLPRAPFALCASIGRQGCGHHGKQGSRRPSAHVGGAHGHFKAHRCALLQDQQGLHGLQGTRRRSC